MEELLRLETPRVLGALVRRFGRFDIAEDAVQEALLVATQRWPVEGVPENPRTWLIRVGYRRMVDLLRSERSRHRRELLVGAAEVVTPPGAAAEIDDSLTLLRLCCHPSLSPGTRVALTLRAVGGLSTAEIAHAYGVSEATMGTRISRAKAQLRGSGARFGPVAPADRDERARSVLQVLYLIYNEGYTASAGVELGRRDLAAEAIRLTRMHVAGDPGDDEAAGLLALMLLTEARRPARVGCTDELVTLAEQDRTRWDRALLDEGTALIDRVWARSPSGPYRIQAAIAAVHGRAPDFARTDWAQIVGLYLVLEKQSPTPPVRLGRVVAAAHAFGPAVGLRLLDELEADAAFVGDRLVRGRVDAVRAHLLAQHLDHDEAARRFRTASDRTENQVERAYLLARAAEAEARADVAARPGDEALRHRSGRPGPTAPE